jgi:hypothetical protein
MICKCWSKCNIKITFKSHKKTLSMCLICAKKRYKSLVNGHNYKIIKIEKYENTRTESSRV